MTLKRIYLSPSSTLFPLFQKAWNTIEYPKNQMIIKAQPSGTVYQIDVQYDPDDPKISGIDIFQQIE